MKAISMFLAAALLSSSVTANAAGKCKCTLFAETEKDTYGRVLLSAVIEGSTRLLIDDAMTVAYGVPESADLALVAKEGQTIVSLIAAEQGVSIRVGSYENKENVLVAAAFGPLSPIVTGLVAPSKQLAIACSETK